MRCIHCGAVLPNYPVNAGKTWTAAEDDTLRKDAEMYRTCGVPVEDAVPLIAMQLGRTRAGIEARLQRLNLTTP